MEKVADGIYQLCREANSFPRDRDRLQQVPPFAKGGQGGFASEVTKTVS